MVPKEPIRIDKVLLNHHLTVRAETGSKAAGGSREWCKAKEFK